MPSEPNRPYIEFIITLRACDIVSFPLLRWYSRCSLNFSSTFGIAPLFFIHIQYLSLRFSFSYSVSDFILLLSLWFIVSIIDCGTLALASSLQQSQQTVSNDRL